MPAVQPRPRVLLFVGELSRATLVFMARAVAYLRSCYLALFSVSSVAPYAYDVCAGAVNGFLDPVGGSAATEHSC